MKTDKELLQELVDTVPSVNNCDGCQAGIPIVNGSHRMGKPGGYPDTMGCTANRYKEKTDDQATTA